MKEKFILFDFDGVIVDSFAQAFEVRNKICPSMKEEQYRSAFDGNIKDWSLTGDGHDEKCRHDIDFFAEYIPKMDRVKVVSGMESVIEKLAKEYTLIVVSSTLTSPIQELLERNGLAHYFKEIMGFDVHTSKIEKMKTVFSKYNATAENCVFITDTLGDIREANHMKVGSIGVLWGFQGKEKLASGNPFRIVDKPTDLPSAISSYFSR
jgi:HAD superfamily hydrolase (TIGR01509 family)